MQIQVSGKHVDVGEALGSRISQELQDGIGKYFERGAQDAEVIVAKEGHSFKVDCWVRLASGQVVFTTGLGGDAHSAFTESLDKLEKRVRRYKRRLKDHHIGPRGLSPEKTEDAAQPRGDHHLAGREAHPAIDLEAMAFLGHHDLGVLRPSFEIFADPVLEFLGDAGA